MPVLLFDARTVIAGSNVCVNTWHVLVPSQPSVAEANNLIAPVKAFYDNHATQRATGTAGQIGVRVLYFVESWWTKPTFDSNHNKLTKGGFNTEPIIIGSAPANMTNGTGGTLLPPQLAAVMSWRTSVSGRSGRGRSYIGSLGSTAQTADKITTATVTLLNAQAATLISSIAAVTVAGQLQCRLAVWSPTKGVIREILTGACNATWQTMRSRVK